MHWPTQLRAATFVAATLTVTPIQIAFAQRQPSPNEAELALPSALWTHQVASPFGMVVSSSPEASWAGVEILESGGNAIDANELDSRGFPYLLRRFYPNPDPEASSYWGSTNTIMIDRTDGTIIGVGDPHRQGVALGATRLVGERRSVAALLPCWRELAAR